MIDCFCVLFCFGLFWFFYPSLYLWSISKITSIKANGLTKTIKVKGYNLETVTNLKYHGAIVTDEGTKREVLTGIAQATSALTKLMAVWKDRKITPKHRIQILRSIVTSTFLYTCETWTLTAELERRIETFEMRYVTGRFLASHSETESQTKTSGTESGRPLDHTMTSSL